MINDNLVSVGVNFFANGFFELIKLLSNECFDDEAIIEPFPTLKRSNWYHFKIDVGKVYFNQAFVSYPTITQSKRL